MTGDILVLAGLFLLAATIYSMAGFGGGSAYIAMLTLAGVPIAHVAVVALVCNVIVVANGSWQFARAGHLRMGLVLPFLIASIPAAYLGGRLVLEAATLQLITGMALGLAGLALLVDARRHPDQAAALPPRNVLWPGAGAIGAALGGLSGMIGIGGGVFLAPALHLLRWGAAAQIAATASVFILLNSLAGLAGKAAHVADPPLLLDYLPLMGAVFIGGQIGSRVGAWRLPAVAIRRVTGAIVIFAAVNLLVSGGS